MLQGDIPIDLDIEEPGKRFLFISRDQRAFTHAIHKYPAKFFPELPRWIIRRYSKAGDVVLDPFMGSGTSNLEAMLLGRPSVGIDIDPFSRFLATAKTTLLDKEDLRSGLTEVFNRLITYEDSVKYTVPDFPYRDVWFKPYVLNELAFIQSIIASLRCSPEAQRFFLVAFSSVIRWVSQAVNNCARTFISKKMDKEVAPGYALSLFSRRLRSNADGMYSLLRFGTALVDIPVGPSALDLSAYGDGIFDLALTSPPYMNAIDYPRAHQLEMYWLGLVSGSLGDLKVQHVGTEVVKSKDYGELHSVGIAEVDRAVASIYGLDRKRAFIAYRFLEDMRLNLSEVYRVLRPGCRYVVVVGSNRVRGVDFETWRYLMAMASTLGFQVETWFISGIINHFNKVPRDKLIKDDYVLVLRK